MSSKLLGSDYLLILLYINDKQPIRGAVRLMKMMFLFNEQIAPILKKRDWKVKKCQTFLLTIMAPFQKIYMIK